jgi:hypothetical protein
MCSTPEAKEDKCLPLWQEWKEEKQVIEEIFKKRGKAKARVQKGISLFIQLLHLVNDQAEVIDPLDLSQLKIKPINVQERLDFIIKRPSLYHSFIQLNELMTELEKQYIKQLAIKKASKQ